MGNAKIYWYPAGSSSGSTRSEIDFGEGVSDIQELPPKTFQDTSQAATGRTTTVFHGAVRRYRIVLERFASSAALDRKLRTLDIHCRRGGHFGFTADTAKAWAAYTRNTHTRGDTVLAVHGQPFWESAPAIGASPGGTQDDVAIIGPMPESNYEILQTAAASSVTSLTVDAIEFSYPDLPVLVRWRWYLPILQLPREERSSSIVTDEHQLVSTLSFIVEESPASIFSGAGLPTGGLLGSTREHGKMTLDDAASGPGTDQPWWLRDMKARG